MDFSTVFISADYEAILIGWQSEVIYWWLISHGAVISFVESGCLAAKRLGLKDGYSKALNLKSKIYVCPSLTVPIFLKPYTHFSRPYSLRNDILWWAL